VTFIKTIPEDEAQGGTARLYDAICEEMGHVPNFVRAFGHRPEVLEAWETLLGKIKETMPFRRYEIATIGAARAIRSSYCMLAHGSNLMRDGMSPEDLGTLARDGGGAGFTEAEEAIFAFAAKVAREANTVTQADIDGLRAHGLTDPEIFDVAAAAGARCFLSKVADAMGAQPDAHYNGLSDSLRAALVVGRPIETADQTPA